MKRPRILRQQIVELCATPGPDDGLDPRLDRPSTPRQKRAARKARQLCAEVTRTLRSLLTGECADDALRDLEVKAVEPAPHAGRLLVTVGGREGSAEEVAERLHRAAGRLRSEIAAAVNRRRAPELVFRVVTRRPPAG